MFNQKLLKELKDNGMKSIQMAWSSEHAMLLPVPLLSELITACKEIYDWTEHMDSFSLSEVFVEADGGGGYSWQAWISKDKIASYGQTPEEAMSHLYIELKNR